MRMFGRQLHAVPELPSTPPTVFKSSCLHLECRLPINLREFLAEQLGGVLDQSDETMLKLAANAEETTLSKLARAIRRYSTNRAHESWEECSVALTRFGTAGKDATHEIVLCLACVRVEFGDGALARHQVAGCVSLALGAARTGTASAARHEVAAADAIRRLIEEFRRLRAAFGLPHFELDSYVRNDQVVFTWRPLHKS
jgi:hypothetical protein